MSSTDCQGRQRWVALISVLLLCEARKVREGINQKDKHQRPGAMSRVAIIPRPREAVSSTRSIESGKSRRISSGSILGVQKLQAGRKGAGNQGEQNEVEEGKNYREAHRSLKLRAKKR